MYQVRIHCGGYRRDFVLADEGGERFFETPEEAIKAGDNSICVQQMGWDWEVENV